MEFGDKQYDNLRNRQFSVNLIVALGEDTTLAKLLPGKFGTVGYGGRQS